MLEGTAGVFGVEAKTEPAEAAVDVKTLHAKIGQLTLENDFLEGALTNRGPHGRNFVRGVGEGRTSERKKMIDHAHEPPIKFQAKVLGISRGTAYYKPRPMSGKDLLLMRKLDELHLNYPLAGSGMLRDLLRQQDV